MTRKRQRLIVHGRVQGVGFRDALCREAGALALRGWVRNRSDGTVEAVVEGMPEAVDALAAWARRGPPAARVERVEVLPGTDERLPDGFERRPTH